MAKARPRAATEAMVLGFMGEWYPRRVEKCNESPGRYFALAAVATLRHKWCVCTVSCLVFTQLAHIRVTSSWVAEDPVGFTLSSSGYEHHLLGLSYCTASSVGWFSNCAAVTSSVTGRGRRDTSSSVSTGNGRRRALDWLS